MRDQSGVVVGEDVSRLLRLPSVLFRAIRNLGLTAQFMSLVALTALAIDWVAAGAERMIARNQILETSLEIEQALARSAFLPIFWSPGYEGLPNEARSEVFAAAAEPLIRSGYVDALKVWDGMGRLVYNSAGGEPQLDWQEPAVMRALQGETVVTAVEVTSPENASDAWGENEVYEVYFPIRNASGAIIAVSEIYFRLDVAIGRVQEFMSKIDAVRAVGLLLGLLFVGTLVHFAERRITAQEKKISESLEAQTALANRNYYLLRRSEAFRKRSADAIDHTFLKIGGELHDGPIQILSMANMYSSQIEPEAQSEHAFNKMRALNAKALTELRAVSVGLILPDLVDSVIEDAIVLAQQAFEDEVGGEYSVDVSLDESREILPREVQIVVYRTVYESLHNARKHSGMTNYSIRGRVTQEGYEVAVCNPVSPEQPPSEGYENSIGGVALRKRAKTIGARLDFVSDVRSYSVMLTVLHDYLKDIRELDADPSSLSGS
ncbi:sensor histidine kinase [Pararhodobacter sp. CCB-MM2]|uniref:sensor histidine kinase n=1 Tax=Pararhodobacter sp. CCB-MM2 TaxID=1786003 RepID=UPI00082ABAD1|nr:hypothetical protein [Pararhodobacter sp. CCB-MM2]